MPRYFDMGATTGSLTNGTSSRTPVDAGGAATGTTFEGLFTGFSWSCTDGSPDGLLMLNWYNASSGGDYLSQVKVADMGAGGATTEDTVFFTQPIPLFSGLYFTITGDGDSNGKGYTITPFVQQLAR